jgi:cytochrome b6
VASGCLLMLYYQPTEATAHESVERIMTQVPYGWLIRSIHVWSKNFFIATVALHFVTVLFARAYRRPRELTWISGVLLMFVVAASGFSGYLLPWNELSYYATLVGTQIPGTLPVVGDFLVRLLRGGDQLTGETLTRFFAAHVMFAPLAMGLLLAIHVLFTRIRGLSVPIGVRKQDVRDRRPFFSEFLLVEACLWLLLFGVIVTLAVFFPAGIGVKADLLKSAPRGIKPEWYFLFLFQTLKVVPKTLGVALFAFGALFLLALPFLDRSTMRGKKSLGWTAAFVALLVYVVVFQIMAWISPGPERPHEDLTAETFRLARSLVSLGLLWAVIGFLVFYLRRLLKENTRVRRLYQEKLAEDS